MPYSYRKTSRVLHSARGCQSVVFPTWYDNRMLICLHASARYFPRNSSQNPIIMTYKWFSREWYHFFAGDKYQTFPIQISPHRAKFFSHRANTDTTVSQLWVNILDAGPVLNHHRVNLWPGPTSFDAEGTTQFSNYHFYWICLIYSLFKNYLFITCVQNRQEYNVHNYSDKWRQVTSTHA